MKLSWTNSTIIKKGFRVIKTRMTKTIIETSKQSMPFGIEANPPKNYIAILADTLSNEEPVVVGYLNPNAIQDLNVGDSALYATDSEGAIKGFIKSRNDGTLELLGASDNMVRFSKLNDAFEQLKNDHNALVNAFNTHVHASSGAPPTPVPSVIPATPSTATIAASKIDEIKTI